MLSCYLMYSRRCALFTRGPHRCLNGVRLSSTSGWFKQTHYEVLGVPITASSVEIKAAFVSLSKQIHPDLNPADPDNHRKFIRLNEAYNTLVRDQTREEYDIRIGLRGGSVSHMSRGGYTPYNTSTSTDSSRFYESDGVGYEGSEFKARQHTYYTAGSARRVPNYIVACGCVGIVLLGFFYFIIGYQYTILKQRKRLDTLDKRNVQYLKESRENARLNGWKRQLEILSERETERKRNIEAAASAYIEATASDRSATRDDT